MDFAADSAVAAIRSFPKAFGQNAKVHRSTAEATPRLPFSTTHHALDIISQPCMIHDHQAIFHPEACISIPFPLPFPFPFPFRHQHRREHSASERHHALTRLAEYPPSVVQHALFHHGNGPIHSTGQSNQPHICSATFHRLPVVSPLPFARSSEPAYIQANAQSSSLQSLITTHGCLSKRSRPGQRPTNTAACGSLPSQQPDYIRRSSWQLRNRPNPDSSRSLLSGLLGQPRISSLSTSSHCPGLHHSKDARGQRRHLRSPSRHHQDAIGPRTKPLREHHHPPSRL